MDKPEGRFYHGKVIGLAKSASHPDKCSIHIEDQSNAPGVISAISYDIFDFMLTTSADIKGKHVLVRETTKSKLARLLLDDTKEKIKPASKLNKHPKVLYKFDPYTLHDFYSVNMGVVGKILYEHQQATLLEKENQDMVRDMLQSFPMYVHDHFYLHELLRSHEYYPEDSERIHLAHFVNELAEYFVQYENGMYNDVYIQQLYGNYLLNVINKDKALDIETFEACALALAAEIRHKETSTQTLFEKSLSNRYEHLSPMIKYMMVPSKPEYPYSKEDFTYITCLYFIQDIWTKYSHTENFSNHLNTLLDVAEHGYFKGIAPNVYPDDNEKAHIPDQDLHGAFIFNSKDGVHRILESCFLSVCDRLQAEYDRGVYNNTRYWDVVGKTLQHKMGDSYERLQRFFYCVYLLDCIREKVIANK